MVLSIESPTTIVIEVWPYTTKDDIETLNQWLKEENRSIVLSDPQFTDSGLLRSFMSSVTINCDGEDYTTESPIELNNKFPLAKIFIGVDCMHGAYVTKSGDKDMTLHFMMNGQEPNEHYRVWKVDESEFIEKMKLVNFDK